MGLFERYLSIRVGACIVAGAALGHPVPGLFVLIAELEFAKVDLVVTVVGVLVEVPVMLSLVALARRSRGAFPADPPVPAPA